MDGKLIVHTQVNDVIGGAIRDVTLTVKQAGSNVLSARIIIHEGCTEADLVEEKHYCEDDGNALEARELIISQLSDRGINKVNNM